MRSVVVVFPAPMWAMMPMFRYRSSGVVRAIVISCVLCAAKMRGDRARTLPAGLAPPCRPAAFSPGEAASASGLRVVSQRLKVEGGMSLLDVRPSTRSDDLPAIVGERLVRFRHLVRVFLLLDRVALA